MQGLLDRRGLHRYHGFNIGRLPIYVELLAVNQRKNQASFSVANSADRRHIVALHENRSV